MPEKLKVVKPPRGLARLALRAPILLYRLGLGRLLGHRFLRLTHVGRKSGRLRQVVLEVVRFDHATHTYYIAVGFGEHSSWYQNILANPHVQVDSAGEHMEGRAEPLSPEQAGQELLDYARRYPLAFRELVHFMGYRLDGSDQDILALGHDVHIFALRPANQEA
ncbi:MAG: nitroreductase family deazaflavin-dependent oxidoreductase [Anaerolineaceae bacterium]|nr:nitroreductase family deazaflavin-dependent oxidoreductase [Anaerolineaceae bacterium]